MVKNTRFLATSDRHTSSDQAVVGDPRDQDRLDNFDHTVLAVLSIVNPRIDVSEYRIHGHDGA